MVFRPHPQVIQRFFNINWFGPPPRVTGGSACPRIDHPASGLPRATGRAVRTRFRFGSDIVLTSLPRGNSQAHYAKGMRSPSRAPAVRGRMISGSVSLPSTGFFSPFPHGTRSLSVGSGIQPCGMGPTDSDGVSRVPPYLGVPRRGTWLRARGCHPLRRAFPGPCARSRQCRTGIPRPRRMNPPVWAPPLSLATTRGISVDFLSSGY